MSSSFVDVAQITVKAGKGGDGAVAFHREKYVPAGGPDGGDGGRGGSIVFVPDDNMSSLMDFKLKRKYVAPNGLPGQGKRCKGKDGESLYIKVPRGTVIRDTATNCIMHDMSDGQNWVVCKGGRGGWGNSHFATPTRHTPRFAKPGLPGESHDITLELKLLADVGLIGFPNVGKSTILSVVSQANPKIANYHFTTLFPNLGVVYVDEGSSFVLADIPGIIEGASEGVGLGHDFLRHVERCRLLVHVVDVSGSEGRDPVEDFNIIMNEISEYNEELSKRHQIIVANKTDICLNKNNLSRLKDEAAKHSFDFVELSAVSHIGISDFIGLCSNCLREIPPIPVMAADYIAPEPEIPSADNIVIDYYDDIWTVEGPWLQSLVSRINFSDYESRIYFDRAMRTAGIYEKMEQMGIKDGDTVSIYDLMFEYKD